MVPEILRLLRDGINEFLSAHENIDSSLHGIVAGNAPAYGGSISQEPLNKVVLSAGSFNFLGSSSLFSKTTGFRTAQKESQEENALRPAEIKVVFTADFDDVQYLYGLSVLEKTAAYLHAHKEWKITDSQGKEWELDLSSESGLKGELASMVRGFSGKLLPALSFTVKIKS